MNTQITHNDKLRKHGNAISTIAKFAGLTINSVSESIEKRIK